MSRRSSASNEHTQVIQEDVCTRNEVMPRPGGKEDTRLPRGSRREGGGPGGGWCHCHAHRAPCAPARQVQTQIVLADFEPAGIADKAPVFGAHINAFRDYEGFAHFRSGWVCQVRESHEEKKENYGL